MQDVVKSISSAIGNTPLLFCKRFSANINARASIYAKLECFNPTGSIKDRAAFYMLEDAIKTGRLKKGAAVCEATSGNSGISLAALCASVGIRCLLVMPNDTPEELRKFARGFGAELYFTPGDEGMRAARKRAEALSLEIDGCVYTDQFTNKAGALAHYMTTGPEIFESMHGDIDVVVVPVGTGGTISGLSAFFREKNPSVRVFGVLPEEERTQSEDAPGVSDIPGIGVGFEPDLFESELADGIVRIDAGVAFLAAKRFTGLEGVSVGPSSGAAVAAVAKLALSDEFTGKNIIVICPDGGNRYFSSSLFDK